MILAAYFPGVNNTTVWADPRSKSQIEMESFIHLAQTAERGKLDFFFLAEGLRLREQRGRIHDLDTVGRPDTLADPRRAGRGDHPPRARRHAQRHVPRAVRDGPPAGHARPPLGRAGGMERGHLVGRVHRRELPPRRVPRPRRPLPARRGVRRGLPRRCGTRGPPTRSLQMQRPASSCATVRRASSTTSARSSTSAASSTCRAARRATRSSCRPATATAGASWRRAPPMRSSPGTARSPRGRRSSPTSRAGWPSTAARPTS